MKEVIRASRFLGFGGPVVVTALILNAVISSAAGLYPKDSVGYDVAWPSSNCTAQPSGAFAIIDVNGGRPFNTNGCFGTEYSWATSHSIPVSLYVNVAYSGAYRKNITTQCQNADQAWAIGCSEADYALNHDSGVTPAAWWLDVETANSWSTGNLALNRSAIQGAIDRLGGSTGATVGVYSTPSAWATITGPNRYTPSGMAGEWIAGGNCGTRFDAAPAWLYQSGTNNGVDQDTGC